MSALFDTMHELEFAPDSLDGARFCLAAIQAAVPCRASMIPLYDARRKDYLVVDSRGEAAESMLLATHGAIVDQAVVARFAFKGQ